MINKGLLQNASFAVVHFFLMQGDFVALNLSYTGT